MPMTVPMTVPMMQVRVVRMFMGQFIMTVLVGMRLLPVPGRGVLVPMMRIVPVRVSVN